MPELLAMCLSRQGMVSYTHLADLGCAMLAVDRRCACPLDGDHRAVSSAKILENFELVNKSFLVADRSREVHRSCGGLVGS